MATLALVGGGFESAWLVIALGEALLALALLICAGQKRPEPAHSEVDKAA